MNILSYKDAVKSDIAELFNKVFTASENAEEGSLIANLVREIIDTTNDKDIYGFIAKDEEEIIGAIFFTRLIYESNVDAFILAPVAISTKHQGKGLGQKLINHGIQHLKNKGVELLFTYGDPSFYSKVGYQTISQDFLKAPFDLSLPEGWLCQSLIGEQMKPIVEKPACVPAFDNPIYW